MTKKYYRTLLFLCLSIAIYGCGNFFQYHFHFNDIDETEVCYDIQQNLDRKGNEMVRCLQNHNRDSAKEYGIYLLEYYKDTLRYWSNSVCAFDDVLDSVKAGKQFFKMKNGYYYARHSIRNDSEYCALCPVRWEYSIQNNYLRNEYNRSLGIPYGSELNPYRKALGKPFYSPEHEVIFSLRLPMNGSRYGDSSLQVWCLYLCSLCLLLGFLYRLGEDVSAAFRSRIWLYLYSFLLLGMRWISMRYQFPGILYSQRLFDPRYYASSMWLPSLGDLLLNVGLLFYLIRYLSNKKEYRKAKERSRTVVFLYCLFGFSILFFCAGMFNSLLSGLILNSSISFSVGSIFDWNYMSFYGFLCIAMLLLSYYSLTEEVVKSFFRIGISRVHALICLFCMCILVFWVHIAGNRYDIATGSMVIAVFSCLYLMQQAWRASFNYSFYLLMVCIFAGYTSFELITYSNQKEKNHRIVLATKIDKQRDYIAEHLFEDIEERMQNDENIYSFFLHRHRNDAELERMMHQNYFFGYFSSYDVSLQEFNSHGKVLMDADSMYNLAHYDSIIAEQGHSTLSQYLYFIDNSSGRTEYIAKIPVKDPKNKDRYRATLIIHLNSKFVQEKSGFPDLLLTDKIPYSKEYSKYSYARYYNDSLVNQYGDFHYYLTTNHSENVGDKPLFKDKDGYNHLFYKVNASSTILMSKKQYGILEYATLFSYLFTLFCVFIVLIFAFRHFPKNFRYVNLNFNNRIQVAMLLLVGISLVIIGSGTVYYIIKKYNAEQYTQISNQITSLLVGIENNSTNEHQKNAAMNLDSLAMPAFLNNSTSDYNSYDLNGNLLYSSQPKLYKEGIISSRMNADAYHNLMNNPRTEYIHNESIGNLEFIAAYVPIRSPNNRVIGYLNVPYFSNQTELKNELSGFGVALINFYILLFAVAIVLALFISNYITKPLRTIGSSMRTIQLGKKNEVINVNRNDEIGALVMEYNRMVMELADSADLLIKSERESAWREMAKQVAHEIKNPLTPMKLNIQHLQRAMKEHPERVEEMLNKTTKTLIEQIDSLSNIATEFANFAQMPRIQNEIMNLEEVISNVCLLFQHSEGIKIVSTFYFPNNEDDAAPLNLPVFGDKEQLSRALANLIKNSIQAMPVGRNGIINISVSGDEKMYLIAIADNGTGIPAEQIPKLFIPNFTTKTNGMGLGLAMVKTSVEGMNGTISFTTEVGMGTTFYICLPRHV